MTFNFDEWRKRELALKDILEIEEKRLKDASRNRASREDLQDYALNVLGSRLNLMQHNIDRLDQVRQ